MKEYQKYTSLIKFEEGELPEFGTGCDESSEEEEKDEKQEKEHLNTQSKYISKIAELEAYISELEISNSFKDQQIEELTKNNQDQVDEIARLKGEKQ